MLLQKVQHPQLQAAVDALRVRASIDGLTFTVCANHLSAQVSELPDPQAPRKVSGASSSNKVQKGNDAKRIRGGGANAGSKRDGIHMPDGSVWTGYYAEWDQLSKDDRQTVIDTRASNKAKGGRGRKISEIGCSGSSKKSLKEIKTQVAALKRKLASLISGKSFPESDDDDVPDNAGDSFGGRQKKKNKKD